MNLATRIASATVLSLALASVPASARGWRGHGGYHGHHRHHGGGIGTLGGLLLGAVIVGGVVAASNDNRDRYQPRYAPQPAYGGGYDEEYADAEPRPQGSIDDYADQGDAGDQQVDAAANPVDDCSRAAERQAQNGGGFARVIGIDRVDNIDGGAKVRGRVEVANGSNAPVRRMSFTCSASFGEVRQLRFG